MLVVNVGNCGVDDFVLLNVTPDTTTADVMYKVRLATVSVISSLERVELTRKLQETYGESMTHYNSLCT